LAVESCGKAAGLDSEAWPPIRVIDMTAIVGLTYLDGVLIMADTEETVSNSTKSECDKLYRFTFPIGTIITGGAGDSHLIQYANQQLHQFFIRGGAQNPRAKCTPEELLAGLNTFARRFFRETIGPYRGLAAELVPSFEMLIAMNYDKQTRLFYWSGNSVVWVPQHESIGSGVIQLHPMLRDVDFAASKESTLFLGVKMMFHAKRIVQGVGGKTEAIALENSGATHYFGLHATKQIEDLVINFEQFLSKFVYTSLSNISETVKDLDKNVNDLFLQIPSRLHEYRERYREILSPLKGTEH
jgi:Proteasome subunit